MSEEKANQREAGNREQVKVLVVKVKLAAARGEFAEKAVKKLQHEVTWRVSWLG